jgi:hypothetical protein
MSNPSVLALCTALLALGGCVQSMSGASSPIVVNVKSVADGCRVTVARDPSSYPLNFVRVDQAHLLQMGREAKGRRAIVAFDMNAEYKCIGAAIITMQQAGLRVDLAPWDSP